MRIAGTALPVSLLLLAACATSPSQEPASSNQSAADEGQDSPTIDPSVPVGASTTAVQDGSLQEQAQVLSLRQQAKKMLVENHLANARASMRDARLQDALGEVQSALREDPDNLDAQRLHTEISSLLGDPNAGRLSTAQMLDDQFALKVQQLKAETEEYVNRGQLALDRKDYDKAIAELSLAVNSVRVSPYQLDWDGMDDTATALLDQAKAERKAALDADLRSAQEASLAALRRAEQDEKAREMAITVNMKEQAIMAFNSGDYDTALEFADQALVRTPKDTEAIEIRDASFRAGRESVNRNYIREKREQFARWQEHLRELEIPWSNVLTLPERERWQELTAERSNRRGLDLSQKVSPSEQALRGQLASTGVVLPNIEEEESLETVINIIRDFTGLPLVVDPAAEEAVTAEGRAFNINFPNEISALQALDFITKEAGEEVTWTVRHDAVLVTTKEKARGKPIVYNHVVQDLIMALTDFTGPRIDRLRLLEELEDDDGGGPFGGTLEAQRLIELDDLVTLIQENVGVGSWDEDGVSIEPAEGSIVITHAPEIQLKVREFLEDLRRFNSSLVTIESKFMTVGDNWIQEVGVDLRGLDNAQLTDVTNGLEDQASLGLDNGGAGSAGQNAAGPPSAGFFFDDGADGQFAGTTQNFFTNALGDALSTIGGLSFQLTLFDDAEVSAILRAVEKSSRFELVNSQTLSVHNTQRAYVTVINQQAYIQDFDVEVAQFQAVADPAINVLHEGVVLDVRPTISHNRQYLTLEIQPTVAQIVGLRTFSTTLGGNTSPVDFQLPELEVQSVNTSAVLPDGGSILLGGLSSIRNIERRAEVPWLARVPVLGFLFKQEGYSDERESLMILITASIRDVRDEVRTKLERQY